MARIAPGFSCFSASAKILLLDLEVLDHRLDDHVGARECLALRVGLSRATAASIVGLAAQPLLEQRLGAVERRLDALHVEILQRSPMPRSAHQAAMSPPMTPAPITCTRWLEHRLLVAAQPLLLQLSERKNTRRRLRDGLARHQRHEAVDLAPCSSRAGSSPCFSKRSISA